MATALASWEAYARGVADAAVRRLDGVAAGIFPTEPERSVYNNAVLERDLDPSGRVGALDALAAAYAAAGVDHYAAWAHEGDQGMVADLEARGYRLSETTRAMGMSLDEEPLAPPDAGLEALPWAAYLEYLPLVGVPAGLLRGVDPGAFSVLAARRGGEPVATAIAFDHDGDCGIFNMSTLSGARRRGLGTALTVRHLQDARERGCTTASLQATPMAERVYARAGFRDLGRILEYAP